MYSHQDTSFVSDAAGSYLLFVLISSTGRYPTERDRQCRRSYKNKGLYDRRYWTQHHYTRHHCGSILQVGIICIQSIGVPRVGNIAVLNSQYSLSIFIYIFVFYRTHVSTTTRDYYSHITTPNILITKIRSLYRYLHLNFFQRYLMF